MKRRFPKSGYKVVEGHNMIVLKQGDDVICEITTPRQPERVARLLSMAPTMYALLLQIQPDEKHVRTQFERILGYVNPSINKQVKKKL